MLRGLVYSLIVSIFIAAFSQSSFSIIIRHDRTEEQYIDLGSKFQVVGFFQNRVSCTLIAPQWALTAAHTVEGNPPFIDYFVMFGGKRYEVEKIIIHPSRRSGAVDSSADMALLKLKERVVGIQPALLYEGDDEYGKKIIIAGYGDTGTGLTGPVAGVRGKLRAATNEIEWVLENSIMFTFDAPPLGTDLEGMSGPGDSGGPALYEENGKLFIMGVGSMNTGKPGPKFQLPSYWSWEGYARISTRRTWLMDTIKADPPTNFWSDLKNVESNAFPRSIYGQRISAFFKAFNSGNGPEIANFNTTHLLPEQSKTTDEWQELMNRYGKYKIYGYTHVGRSLYSYLVYSEREKIWRGVYFEFESAQPFKIKNFVMWDPTPPKEVIQKAGKSGLTADRRRSSALP